MHRPLRRVTHSPVALPPSSSHISAQQGKRLQADYCGCQVRTVDYCIGMECGEHASCVSGADGSLCICDQGYTDVGDRCVDRQSVKLTLIGPERVKLVQGDECASLAGLGLEVKQK